MGWTQVRTEIYAHLSSHNSEQDGIDDDLWEEFSDRVKAIAAEHRYKSLGIDVYEGPR